MNKFKWLAVGAVGALAVLGIYGYIHRDMFLLDDDEDEDEGCGNGYPSCDGDCANCECRQECDGEDEEYVEQNGCEGCECDEGCAGKQCQTEA